MFLSRADLLHAKGRFALVSAVLALVTFLVILLGALTTGLQRASTSAVDGLDGDALVLADTGSTPSLASSELSGSALTSLEAEGGTPLGVGAVRVGVPDADSARLATAAVFARPSTTGVSLPPEVADSLGVHPGSEVVINGTTVHVDRIADVGSYAHQPVITLPLTQWQDDLHGSVSAVTLPEAPASLPDGTLALTGGDRVKAVPGFTSENGSLLAMQVLVIGISALVIGMFFVVWTIQRTRDLAVARALGASRGWLLRDALGQAVVVLLVGLVVGGALAAAALAALSTTTMPLAVTLLGTGGPVVALAVLGLLGAGVAVVRVTRVDPLLALAR